MGNEIMPYKKKSTRRPPKKAKHKHQYADCVLEYTWEKFDPVHGHVPEKQCSVGSYCTACGKIGEVDWALWRALRRVPGGFAVEPTDRYARELDPATRTLSTFKIADYIRTKYVDLPEDETEVWL